MAVVSEVLEVTIPAVPPFIVLTIRAPDGCHLATQNFRPASKENRSPRIRLSVCWSAGESAGSLSAAQACSHRIQNTATTEHTTSIMLRMLMHPSWFG